MRKIQVDAILSFFEIKKPLDVAWVHRVNERKRLKRYCSLPETMMIEGDIILSTVTGRVEMAHPLIKHRHLGIREWLKLAKNKANELSFEEWLKTTTNLRKGIKLDFKDPLAVVPCLEIVKNSNINPVPILFNADVFRGPSGKKPLFSARQFIEECSNYYPESILSIGWTTERSEKRYTKTMMEEALRIDTMWRGEITFPIRLCFLKDCWSEIKMLLENPKCTITIWNELWDWQLVPKKNELMKWIKGNLDPNRVFCDITDDNGQPIRF